MKEVLRWLTISMFYGALVKAAIQDIRTWKIAEDCYKILLAISVFSICTMPELMMRARVLGGVCVSIPMLLVCCIAGHVFGGGDIKLMAFGGFFLGYEKILLAAFIGLGLAGVWALFLVIVKKRGRKDMFPLAPFLCCGMILSASIAGY